MPSAGWPVATPSSTPAAAVLGLLQLVPADLLVGGVRHRGSASSLEDVRMPPDQLVGQLPCDVVDVEAAVRPRRLGGDPGVEEHLQQHVAELLADGGDVVRLHRLDQLVALLDEVAQQRGVGLLGVPGAAAGRAQPIHHRDRVQQPGSRRVRLAREPPRTRRATGDSVRVRPAVTPSIPGTTCRASGSHAPSRGFTCDALLLGVGHQQQRAEVRAAATCWPQDLVGRERGLLDGAVQDPQHEVAVRVRVDDHLAGLREEDPGGAGVGIGQQAERRVRDRGAGAGDGGVRGGRVGGELRAQRDGLVPRSTPTPSTRTVTLVTGAPVGRQSLQRGPRAAAGRARPRRARRR